MKCWWDSVGGSYGAAKAVCCGTDSSPQPVAAGASEQWFAVETRYRFEKKVFAQLDHLGFKVFLPLLTEHHRWSDRQKVITVPLFPGYAFVFVDQSRDSRQIVLRTAGLIRFVSFGGIVVAVPPKQIEHLQLLLRQNGLFSLHPFVHAGQRVRIRGGCLHGLEGILVRNETKKLVISIQSIQRSLAIDIEGYELEVI
ncbi:MAG: UpxY family transcription antiterminator [Candidatus Sulfotelmatobacter sp.]